MVVIITTAFVITVLGKAKLGSQSWDDHELGSEWRPFSHNDLTTNVKYGMSKMEEVVKSSFHSDQASTVCACSFSTLIINKKTVIRRSFFTWFINIFIAACCDEILLCGVSSYPEF